MSNLILHLLMQSWIVLRCIFSIIQILKIVSRLSLQRYQVNLAIVKKLYPKLPLTNCLLIDINYLLPAFSVFSDLDIID